MFIYAPKLQLTSRPYLRIVQLRVAQSRQRPLQGLSQVYMVWAAAISTL